MVDTPLPTEASPVGVAKIGRSWRQPSRPRPHAEFNDTQPMAEPSERSLLVERIVILIIGVAGAIMVCNAGLMVLRYLGEKR